MLILTLILACEPETIREGDAEEVDLSGYATLEDLAALQVELDELRDKLAMATGNAETVVVECDETNTAQPTIDGDSTILAVIDCYGAEGDGTWTCQARSFFQFRDQTDIAASTVKVECAGADNWVEITYLPPQG